MAELRIGTCSWKYPSWAGLVYSAAKGVNYLEEYARRYRTVEIDQWFWSLFPGKEIKLPDAAQVTEYRSSVPAEFRFTVKVPNSISLTHYYHRDKSAPLVPNPSFLSTSVFQRFLSLLAPLEDKLGPLMLQFEYLNLRKMRSQDDFQLLLGEFFDRIPRDYDYAVETRNPKYLNQSYFEFLQRLQLTPVLLQGYYMPDIREVYRKWRSLLAGRETIIIRLHGPGRDDIEKMTGGRWNTLAVPRDEEIKGVVEIVTDLIAQGTSVYMNVNNHFEGSAPLTIERIKQEMS